MWKQVQNRETFFLKTSLDVFVMISRYNLQGDLKHGKWCIQINRKNFFLDATLPADAVQRIAITEYNQVLRSELFRMTAI